MARFFIDRPIFAWVIAIIMMMAGALAIYTLPIEQYPSVAPPAVTIAGNYPGASAKTVEDSVTQVIEQQMNGIDNLMYMSSSSDSFGNAQISLTFAPGTDPDIAAQLIDPAMDAMMGAVHRYDGTVNRVQGDGIMALFGAPIAQEDHALPVGRDLRVGGELELEHVHQLERAARGRVLRADGVEERERGDQRGGAGGVHARHGSE